MKTPLTDRRRLFLLGLSEIGRRLCRRTVPLRLALARASARVPDRLIVAPTDLRAQDSFIAEEILEGRFPLAGRLLETDGNSPFSVELPSRGFAEKLHGFAWLRHLRSNRSDEACASARQVVEDWIALHGRRRHGLAWEVEVVAERVIAWLSHSTVILQGAEAGFYRRLMRSLARQVAYLAKAAGCLGTSEVRLRVRIALAMASIAMPASPRRIRRASLALDRELERQILADGGHVSRNPRAILDLLIELLPLRQTYINLGYDLPQKLIPAIDRMYPALRFFRHQDGDLALFNGASATPASELLTVLRYDESAGQPSKSLPHMLYHRLAAADTLVIMDTGRPLSAELSRQAHAGPLSFEMSSGQHRFIVNSGAPRFSGRNYRQAARLTAAHSTVTLGDTSSSRFSRLRLTGPVMTGGGPMVEVERGEDEHGNDWLRASHDGYLAEFGYLHERLVGLGAQGDRISGHDRLLLPEGRPADVAPVGASARFHVHPLISLWHRDEESVELRAPDGDGWIFSASGFAVAIEEDIFFADVSGMRASQQLVIEFSAPETTEVAWNFSRAR